MEVTLAEEKVWKAVTHVSSTMFVPSVQQLRVMLWLLL